MRPPVTTSPGTSAPRRASPAPGRPLDPAVRAQLEPRFRHDFRHVRVHTDDEAAAAAGAMGARAFTAESDVAFAAGQYAPGSSAGRELIAHELAHVVQQARGGGQTPDAEARADIAASQVMRGSSVDAASLGGAAVGVQAKPDEPAPAPKGEVDVVSGADVAAPAAPASSATVLDGFVRDKSTPTKKHLEAIDQVAFSTWLHLSLYADAKASIAVTGHTDTTGGEKRNSGLSAARADSAKAALEAALAKQGVDPAKLDPIATSGHGESKLRVPTADEIDEPRNRRVEIEVTITVKTPPPPKAPATKPLPGTPGGPKIWEVPGVIEGLEPEAPRPPAPRAPTNKREWLKNALERDPLLKKLPKKLREKAIDGLKDADEKVVDAIIDAAPFDDEYKKAAKAAAKALLQTLKGREFKPPSEPPRGIPEDMLKAPSFPKAPGEFILKLPPSKF